MLSPIIGEPHIPYPPFPPLILERRLDWFAAGMACGFILAFLVKNTLTDSEKSASEHKDANKNP